MWSIPRSRPISARTAGVNRPRAVSTISVAAIAVALAACGGGSDTVSDTSVADRATTSTSIAPLEPGWTETTDYPEWSHWGSRTGPLSPTPNEGSPLADGAYVLGDVFFDANGELSSIQVQPFVAETTSNPPYVEVPLTTREDTRAVVRTHGCQLGERFETAWLGDWGTFLSTMRSLGTDIVDWSEQVTASYDVTPGDFVDYAAIPIATDTIRPSDCLRSFVWSATDDGAAQPWFIVWWSAGPGDTIDQLWRSSVYPAAISIESGVATFYFDARILNIGG